VTAGISVAPEERFRIRFAAPQEEGTAVVSIVEGPEVAARAVEGAATFATGANGLTIGNRGSSADYEIELPAAAPWIEILVGDTRLLLKDGDRILTSAPAIGGRYRIPLRPGDGSGGATREAEDAPLEGR
jgi:hypothetical protein